jgi:homoserine O-acetyltransferase
MFRFIFLFLLMTQVLGAHAQNYPQPVAGLWVAKDFKFHTGEIFKELNIGYQTVGDPSGVPVLMLHGTAGSANSLLNMNFAGELFGPGQALDAKKYFIILPDSIGVGRSSKPSDGLKRQFPKYNYDDMVLAQYRLVTQGLGIDHLRLVSGNSMGGMQTWLWGIKYPEFMDLLAPLASTPTAMSGRNWMMRRLIIDAIQDDPTWNKGNYTVQPKSLKFASTFFSIATSGGSKAMQRIGSTRQKADDFVNSKLNEPMAADANDNLFQWESSSDYDPEPFLKNIKARVLIINAEDDERNPPELGRMEQALKQLKNARLYLIPSSDLTSGHGTTGQAKWWKQELLKELQSASSLKP